MKSAPLPKNTEINCLNCGSKINTSDTFCQACGQKIKDYRLSAWLLIKEVSSSIFNLDSKFAKTLLNIWKPVKLTKAYVAGERKRYLNPGRLFIVSFFLLSAIFSIYIKNIGIKNVQFGKETTSAKVLYASEFRQDLMTAFDSLVLLHAVEPSSNVDSLRYKMFLSDERMEADSIDSPGPIFHYSSDEGPELRIEPSKGDFKIATKDILELKKEELFEKYEVKGYLNQILLVQYLKFKENPVGWIIFMITNSLWTIVISTFILALFMKLLYIRRYYHYVEHLILLMNFQSLAFILVMLTLLIGFAYPEPAKIIFPFVWGLLSIWFVVVLKKYYDQSIFKTLIKSILLTFIHALILSICFLIVAVVSFALY